MTIQSPTVEQLAACPFCGERLVEFIMNQGRFYHPSNDCVLADMHVGPLKVAAWNQRTLPAADDAVREKITKAIRATEYKYFGDYEMSDDQRDAVDQLVLAARAYLSVQPVSGEVTQEDRDAAAEYMRRFPELRLPEAFRDHRVRALKGSQA